MKRDKTTRALTITLVIGMCIAAFLIYEHFSESASEFCSFGEGLDCGVVNKSPYANVDGLFYLLVIDYGWNWVPFVNISDINVFFDFITTNAFLGLLTLLLVLLLNTKYKNKDLLFITKERNVYWIRGILVFGVLYGLYLFYIQHSILKTYCIFCLALDITLLTAAILSWRIKR